MASRRPQHVIWITTDHLRFDHIRANGNPEMITPNLDALVAGGTSFQNCYTQSGVCMPSRCSFMTGLYPQQTQVTHNGHCLPPDFSPVVAKAFAAGGFQTAQIGKLHFQPHDNLDFDPTPRNRYGFDVFWPSEERGNYSDGYYHWLEGRYPQYAATMRCPRSTDWARLEVEKTPHPLDAPWQASQAGWIVDTAVSYLRLRRQRRHFVHLGFYNPHPPLTPTREAWQLNENVPLSPPEFEPEEWRDKPEPMASMLKGRSDWSPEDFVGYKRGLNAMVTELDLALGWLFEELKRMGLWEDTLLVLSSDHGDMCGDHGMTHKAPHHYDEIMHVPLVLHWPAGLKADRKEPGLIEMTDLLPTLLDLSGCFVPAEMAGVSVADGLLSETPLEGRPDVYAYESEGWAMVRSREFKYLRFESTGGEVLFDYKDAKPEVINHASDPDYDDLLAEYRERMLGRTLMACRSPLAVRHPF